MPSPKNGTVYNLVSPAAPTAAQDAADDTAGSTDSAAGAAQSSSPGKSSSTSVSPFNPGPAHKPDPTKTGWIEVALIGEDKKPIPGESYTVTLPDGSVAQGTLDEKGVARVEGFDPGSCQITFPNLDKDAWQSA